MSKTINFKVVDITCNPLDPRCSAHPGEECCIVRLRPVEDTHIAAVGDVVVVMPCADGDGLVAEKAAVMVANPTNPDEVSGKAPPSMEAKAAVAGTKAVLTIG